jgi:signal transduction histidine kinase
MARSGCRSRTRSIIERDTLRLSIQDDGVGGADPSRGSGMIGLRDRVDALGGTIAVESPAADGTRIDVELPVSPGFAFRPREMKP